MLHSQPANRKQSYYFDYALRVIQFNGNFLIKYLSNANANVNGNGNCMINTVFNRHWFFYDDDDVDNDIELSELYLLILLSIKRVCSLKRI